MKSLTTITIMLLFCLVSGGHTLGAPYISASDLYRNISLRQVTGFAGLAYGTGIKKIYISKANSHVANLGRYNKVLSEINFPKDIANEIIYQLNHAIKKARPDMDVSRTRVAFIYVNYSYSQLFDWQAAINSAGLGTYASGTGINVVKNVVDIYVGNETQKKALELILEQKQIPEDSYAIYLSTFIPLRSSGSK